MVKILIWPTTFGADLWSLTKYLSQRTDVRLKVVMDEPEKHYREGVAELFPLQAEIIRRRPHNHILGAVGFRPDVTIIDNRVPLRATSQAGFVLWHGFGWKGPNDVQELSYLHATLKRAWGSGMKPNPRLRWQCFGPWDFEHRTTVSGFHPENCRIIGAASHDDLRIPLDKKRAAHLYPFDIINRKTVLFAPTWHYGEVFAHWGQDADLFEKLTQRLSARDVNVILRLHDSFRFDRGYRVFLEGLATRHDNLMLKFKDKSPDNYIDMQVSDALITNFSSIANLYYATRRPTVHIYPVADADEAFLWRRYSPIGLTKTEVSSARFIWKLPPEDNGGLLARNFTELLELTDQALDDPRCCTEAASSFLERHMLSADGKSCERAFDVISELSAVQP
jgi:hypothetical protein